MKIALIYDGLFPYRIGGVERWYKALAVELTRRGHDVVYVTCRDWQGALDEPFAVEAVAPSAGAYGASGARRAWPAVRFGIAVYRYTRRHRDIDVLHTASFPYFSLFGAWAGRARRTPLVVDVVEVWSAAYWRSYAGAITGTVGFALQSVALRLRASRFVFSELQRRRVPRHDATKLPTLFARAVADAPAPAAEPPLLVFVGRLIPEKGVLAVPAIVAEVVTRRAVRCVIVGTGPVRDALDAEIMRLGLTDSIRVEANLADADVDRLIAEAVCLLHPSRREGYGLVVVEAAALGTPALTLAHPENAAAELIAENANGWVIASDSPQVWADRIVDVIDNAAMHKANAFRWAHEADLAHATERTVDVIEAAYARLTRERP